MSETAARELVVDEHDEYPPAVLVGCRVRVRATCDAEVNVSREPSAIQERPST